VPSARNSTKPPSMASTRSSVCTDRLPPAVRSISPPPSESEPPRAVTVLRGVRTMSPFALMSRRPPAAPALRKSVFTRPEMVTVVPARMMMSPPDELPEASMRLEAAEVTGPVVSITTVPPRAPTASPIASMNPLSATVNVPARIVADRLWMLRCPVSVTTRAPKSSVQPLSIV
jgi:hypothetical protein